MKEFVSGAIPSDYDPRDYSAKVAAQTFPPAYTVRDVDGYDQGDIGNCVMQSLRSAPHAATGIKPGCTFGYGRWRTDMLPGMRPNEACNGFVKEGLPSEAADSAYLEMPDAAKYAQLNEARLLEAAKLNLGWTWARLHTEAEIKATLMQEATRPGTRCIVCLPWCGVIRNGRWVISDNVLGYHEMAIVGWDDVKGWKLRNSWNAGSGGLATQDDTTYLWIEIEDIFECNDVIGLFPPVVIPPDDTEQEETVVVRRTLRLKSPRMTGEDVKEAQALMNRHGAALDPDGVFGPASNAATMSFQKAKALTADGIIGAKTWAALDGDPEAEPDKGTKLDIDAVEKLISLMVGDHYVIGGQGHEMTAGYVRSRAKAEPAYFTNGRLEWLLEEIDRAEQLGRMLYCEDCSGIIMKTNEILHFFSASDLTADSIWRKLQPISKAEVQPGDFLFRESGGRMVHVAWVGRRGVYEAAGTVYGVVFRADTFGRVTYNRMSGERNMLRDWTHYGRYI